MKEDLFNTEKLTVLAEKTLVGLLSVRPSHLERQNWATLVVDSFEKYEHTKEILLLRNKVAKHPALSWHSLQKNGQDDGGRGKRTIPRNIKGIWKMKKKDTGREKTAENLSAFQN